MEKTKDRLKSYEVLMADICTAWGYVEALKGHEKRWRQGQAEAEVFNDADEAGRCLRRAVQYKSFREDVIKRARKLERLIGNDTPIEKLQDILKQEHLGYGVYDDVA